MNAKSKKTLAIVGVVTGGIVALIFLAKKKTIPVSETPNNLDDYYQTYNNPPIALGGNSSNQGGYNFGDTKIEGDKVAGDTIKYGMDENDLMKALDAMAKKICACSKRCPESSSISNLFSGSLNTSLLFPAVPDYMRDYVTRYATDYGL